MDGILKFLLLFLFCWVALIVSVACIYLLYALIVFTSTTNERTNSETPGASFRSNTHAIA
nr:P6 protein [Carrot closterovirus 3]